MSESSPLQALASALGVHTEFVDGLGRSVAVEPETLVAVCRALGAEIVHPGDAAEALRALESARAIDRLPPVSIAWDGCLEPIRLGSQSSAIAVLELEDGGSLESTTDRGALAFRDPLPFGTHRLTVERDGLVESAVVLAAPLRAWSRPDRAPGWGLAAHLAALRSSRSGAVGDLRDLERLARWTASLGGDCVAVLPLLPTFNGAPPEPSPYAPVSRLFWSELILDLDHRHRAAGPPQRLDVTRADAEVRAALRSAPAPDPDSTDPELRRYACFRGAQARLGREWRRWPAEAQSGAPSPSDVDPDEERFHLVAQVGARAQLRELGNRLETARVRLGLDLAVGVHPDGYDPWSRPELFASRMSVGAPPDPGFPSGQDWGFAPVLPAASRAEGHTYFSAAVAHQASVAGLLRVDHVMALRRLYWIPDGADVDRGTYVDYPAEELFASLTLQSHRHRCEIVGEDLGTVPPEIAEALPRHAVRRMFLVQFAAAGDPVAAPEPDQVAFVGTHDTPTLAGWVDGSDIEERVRCGLLDASQAPTERERRAETVERLERALGLPGGSADSGRSSPDAPGALLDAVLAWLGASSSPLVMPWLEDLWLEPEQVNLPGTRSSERPNWQRPMGRTLEEALVDPVVVGRLRRLAAARRRAWDAEAEDAS